MRIYLYSIVLLTSLLPGLLLAQAEAIQDYHVDLRIQTDRTLEVTETITVTAAGDQIKRGITRAFPLRSERNDERRREQSYEIISVRRDGREEPYHTDRKRGDLILYIGERDVLLDPGTYTYEITYRSPEQIYFHEELDEISWTAIGTNNTLPVRNATVTVRTPDGILPTQWSCYTGTSGSRNQNCRATQEERTVQFAVAGLEPGQGLTVAVGWPAGRIDRPPPPPPPVPPTWIESNASWLIGLIGFFGTLFYAYTRWERYGQDPPAPPVRIRFDAPQGLSPASVGYIATGHHSNQHLVASLVDLATKGYLEIDVTEKKGFFTNSEIFVLRPCGKVAPPGELPPEQQRLYELLLRDGDPIELDGSYNSLLAKASTAHTKSLKKQHGDFLSEGNNGWKVLPLLGILLPAIVGSAVFLKYDSSGYATPFLILLSVGFVIGVPFFVWLIRQPTPEKLQLRAEIKGLKEYFALSKKEHDRLPDAPQMTETHYRQMLPYAMALGVDSNYTEALAADLVVGLTFQHYYLPSFGRQFRNEFASTATQPSSSSSGGGGSVGSGGGGGGVGGW